MSGPYAGNFAAGRVIQGEDAEDDVDDEPIPDYYGTASGITGSPSATGVVIAGEDAGEDPVDLTGLAGQAGALEASAADAEGMLAQPGSDLPKSSSGGLEKRAAPSYAIANKLMKFEEKLGQVTIKAGADQLAVKDASLLAVGAALDKSLGVLQDANATLRAGNNELAALCSQMRRNTGGLLQGWLGAVRMGQPAPPPPPPPPQASTPGAGAPAGTALPPVGPPRAPAPQQQAAPAAKPAS